MPKSDENKWSVRDKNARAQDAAGQTIPRKHEPVPGKVYQLFYDKDTPMPEAHARVFLKDPSFIVTDADGAEVPSLSSTALLRVAPDKLPANVVIADVAELTDVALLTRCAQLPGGQRFTTETAREVLIRFLVDANAMIGRPASTDDELGLNADDAGEVDTDDMDDASTDRLLQGA